MSHTENRTFDEIRVGERATFVHALTGDDFTRFAAQAAALIGDGLDPASAGEDNFRSVAAQGSWAGAALSALIAGRFPGAGSRILSQSVWTPIAAAPGDTMTIVASVTSMAAEGRRVTLDVRGVNQRSEVAMTATLEVAAPAEKVVYAPIEARPSRRREKGRRYRRLLAMSRGYRPLLTAVVHPVDEASLTGAVEAAKNLLIDPIFVGPEAKIRRAAEIASIDIRPYAIVSTEHSHAAADKAVAMAHAGEVEALMKGALHTDELMHAVVHPENGLRTARRISHVFAIDAPAYPRPLFITDAAVNIRPSLMEKRDIVQNAIELAIALGIVTPRVAILSAVETVSPDIASTIDAAALCKMADRGQIIGGILDGPLAFDNAVSLEAARTKGIVSPVAGEADILLVPDIEAGNMLAKQLEYLADAMMAGVVLGARVPIMLTSRSDNTIARLGSCAIALILTRHRR